MACNPLKKPLSKWGMIFLSNPLIRRCFLGRGGPLRFPWFLAVNFCLTFQPEKKQVHDFFLLGLDRGQRWSKSVQWQMHVCLACCIARRIRSSNSCTPSKANMEPKQSSLSKAKSYSKPRFLGSILVFGVYFLVANYIMEHWDEVCRAVKAWEAR